jgi:hypothetical protein
VARTHLAITVELVHGVHTGDLWPRPGRVLIAARTATFEQLGKAIDDAFARWDHNHLHEFTLADGTVIIPVRWSDGEEPERSLDGAKTRLGRLRPGEQFALPSTWATTGSTCAPSPRSGPTRWKRSGSSRSGRCRAGAGATFPTSTAAAGTATTAAAPCPRPPTGWLTSRRSCPGGDPGGHG